MRKGILVLGMHRSGTSAVTRVLSLLGAALPSHLHPPGPGNEKGHWESDPLIRLHERMLREAGSRWDDWRAFDPAVLEPARLDFFRRELVRLLAQEYDDAPLVVLKDPRICRFVPLYEEVLAASGIAPRFIHVIRNPLAVASSLGKRDAMTESFVELMWLRHMLEAEAATRGQARAFVSYDTFLAGWSAEVARWADALDISWPRSPRTAMDEIQAFLSPDHRHHAHTQSDLDDAARAPAWSRRAYSALLSLAADPTDETALYQLSLIHAEFDAFAPILGDATFEELARREARLMKAHRAAENRATEFQSEIERMRAATSERDRRIAALENQVAALSHEIATRNGHVARLSHEVTARNKQVAQLSREIAMATLQLERVFNSRSWRATAPLRLVIRVLTRMKQDGTSSTLSH